MDAASFWKTIDTRIDDAINRSKPYTATVTSVNSEGVQIQERGSSAPLGERFKTLRGLKINVGDDVQILPQSNLVVGAIGGDNIINITDVSGLQSELNAKGGPIQSYDNVNAVDIFNLQGVYASAGLLATPHPNNNKIVTLHPHWGTGTNQVPRGDHNHDNRYFTESEVTTLLASKGAVNQAAGSEIGETFVTVNNLYVSGTNGIRAWVSGTQLGLGVVYGNTTNTVSMGNHKHNPNIYPTASSNSPWGYTHTTNANTSARFGPGTEYWVVRQHGVGSPMMRLGDVEITSGGISWWQCHSYLAGICWVNKAHLTAA